MNYKKIYFKLIKNRKNNPLKDCYTETHHIIPRSLGGKNFKSNLIVLSAREHFIAHLLLSKMFSDKMKKAKMIMALAMMMVSSKNQNRYRFTSRQFSFLRELHAKSMSVLQGGKLNSQSETMWITNGIENKKIKIFEQIEGGWKKGRFIESSLKEEKTLKKEKNKKQKLEKKEYNKKHYTNLYKIYCNFGWDEIKKNYPYSKPNFIQKCIKYALDFKPQNGKKRGSQLL
jgi:hypothetical protein